MSYSVRHQVFVSSTFTDLKEERAEVIQAIWELDCIPTGMEAFVASTQSQWDVIEHVIDECDYYVLIIGGRYGSLAAADGISYTEKEYRYAKKAGLPVLAFVHGAPDEIPQGKSEQDVPLRAKLIAFRDEVMKTHPVREWRTASELGGLVSRSLSRAVKVSPRPGWIRNDGSSPIALLEQISRLTEENRALREITIDESSVAADDSLASDLDEIDVYGVRKIDNQRNYETDIEEWHVLVTWNDVWAEIGPVLINEASESALLVALARFHLWEDGVADRQLVATSTVNVSVWHEVLIQFRALGFMVPGTKSRGASDRNSYWQLTPRGDRHLLKLRARKRPPAPPTGPGAGG